MWRRSHPLAIAPAFLTVGLLLPQVLHGARAPVGRQYMVLLVEHHSRPPVVEVTPACLRFDSDEVCDHEDACGDFVVVEKWSAGNRWQASLEKGQGSDRFELLLSGYTEVAGPDSSIGGTLVSTETGVRNGGFAGVQAPRRACLDFAVRTPAEPAPTPTPGECIPPERCCKICRTGKACGDTCISQTSTCHVGRGCACNASEVCR